MDRVRSSLIPLRILAVLVLLVVIVSCGGRLPVTHYYVLEPNPGEQGNPSSGSGDGIAIGVKPFLDIGRTFDDNSSITFRGWHPGGGVGLMLSWNLSTVINFDYAWSTEGTAFYMEAGLQF